MADITNMNIANQAILFTLRNEDDLWDKKARLEDLDDGAGKTYIGLTEKYDGKYLKDSHNIDIVGLSELYKRSKPMAIKIIVDCYKNKYWNGRGFDQIKSDRIAIRLFDLAVNCGFGGLNDICNRAGLGKTFNAAAVNHLINTQTEATALTIIKIAALDRYKSLRNWKKFGKGWENRLKKDEFNVL